MPSLYKQALKDKNHNAFSFLIDNNHSPTLEDFEQAIKDRDLKSIEAMASINNEPLRNSDVAMLMATGTHDKELVSTLLKHRAQTSGDVISFASEIRDHVTLLEIMKAQGRFEQECTLSNEETFEDREYENETPQEPLWA